MKCFCKFLLIKCAINLNSHQQHKQKSNYDRAVTCYTDIIFKQLFYYLLFYWLIVTLKFTVCEF